MKKRQNGHFVHNSGLNLWVFNWYMKVLESSNTKVVFLTIEISSFPKCPYLLNYEFIWVCKYLDEARAFADCILDWAPLSILEISWATNVKFRWFKIFYKYKTIIYNFHEDTFGWIDGLHGAKIVNSQIKSRAHIPTGICLVSTRICMIPIGTSAEFKLNVF